MLKRGEICAINKVSAEVAESADALDLGSNGATRGSSTLPLGILNQSFAAQNTVQDSPEPCSPAGEF